MTLTLMNSLNVRGLADNNQLEAETTFKLYPLGRIPPHITSKSLISSYTPHDPIYINGNTNFNDTAYFEDWPGNGTASNPYIINGLEITGLSNDNLIEIKNTDVFFHITNCLLNGGGLGIRLNNISNGYIFSNIISNNHDGGINLSSSDNNTLSNNTLSNNDGTGIWLSSSTNNTLFNNTAYDNNYDGIYIHGSWNNISANTVYNNSHSGIEMRSSANNTIANNTAYNNHQEGIFLWGASNNTVANNTAYNNYNGISLWYSMNNTLSTNVLRNNTWSGIALLLRSANNTILGNNLENNGLVILYDTFGVPANSQALEYFIQGKVTDNKVNGRDLVYWQNVYGGTVPSGAGQVILINTTGVEVTGQDLCHASIGLLAAHSSNSYIHHNDFYNNSLYGICLDFSDNNILSNNDAYNNDDGRLPHSFLGHGILLRNSTNNTLSTNNIHNNRIYGILLESSVNNTLANNFVFNNSRCGIYLAYSPNNTIINNYLTNDGLFIYGYPAEKCLQAKVVGNTVNNRPLIYWQNTNGGTVPSGAGQVILVNTTEVEVTGQDLSQIETGLWAFFSSKLYIHSNTFYNNYGGIYLWFSNNNTLSQNSVFNSSSDEFGYSVGIWLYHCANNTLSQNSVSNSGAGIVINYYGNNTLTQNTVSNNGIGISLGGSPNSTVSHNSVSNNDEYGINVFWSSSSIFSNNTLSHNNGYGINLNSDNCLVKWNDFIGNNPEGSSQAYDDGMNNTITSNYWSDWLSPDANMDGIVDHPYAIDGNANNTDPYPRTSLSHQLTVPMIISPRGGEVLSGLVTIQWTPARDSWGFQTTYSLYYSSDSGISWNLIATDIASISYAWDTTTVPDGSNYKIKVVATGFNSLTAEDSSAVTFTIHNTPTPPTITFPNGGETLNGTVTIRWTASSDSFGHQITYYVYYSDDGGNTWFLLTSDPAITGYIWDTTTISDGSNYKIKVVAICSAGLMAEDSSDNTFTIQNTVIATPGLTIILFPAIIGVIWIRRIRRKRNAPDT